MLSIEISANSINKKEEPHCYGFFVGADGYFGAKGMKQETLNLINRYCRDNNIKPTFTIFTQDGNVAISFNEEGRPLTVFEDHGDTENDYENVIFRTNECIKLPFSAPCPECGSLACVVYHQEIYTKECIECHKTWGIE